VVPRDAVSVAVSLDGVGQSRPVTIYRLVARDTIEDRILALHRQKRELADGVLAGSDLAGRMTEEDLLELIRGAS
jgi:SNF2 family DNA or RNA helicase